MKSNLFVIYRARRRNSSRPLWSWTEICCPPRLLPWWNQPEEGRSTNGYSSYVFVRTNGLRQHLFISTYLSMACSQQEPLWLRPFDLDGCFPFPAYFQIRCWRRGWDTVSCCLSKFHFCAVVEWLVWMRQKRTLHKTKKGRCVALLEHQTRCHTRSFKLTWLVILH